MRKIRITQQLLCSIAFILFSLLTKAQSYNITGSIKTSDGKPAAQVNIQLKEIKKSTVSSEDGSYTIDNIQPGNYTLIASFVGLQTIQQKITVTPIQKTFDFTLVENQNELKEVLIVSARNSNEKAVSIGKLPIKPMDLPQSVVTIDKDVLERQQNLRLSEVLANTTGIYVMGTTGGGQEELAGRGYSYSSSNTFKNGARFNNSTMPEISALEKVEVMKGSAAILFGNVAAGGVINLVTKKPRFENGGSISFRAGSNSFYKPSIDIYGPLNASKKIAYRVNTSYENSKSFRDVVKAERFYINPSFLFKLGNRTEILVEGDYLKDNRTSDFGSGAIDYEIADIPRSRFLGAEWSYLHAEQRSVSVTTTHRINDKWQIRNLTSYQGYTNDLYGTSRPNASREFVQTDGTWARGLQRSGNNEKYAITQFDLTGNFNTGKIAHTLLIGTDADKYITDSRAYVYSNPAIGNKNIYDTVNIFDLSKNQQRTDIPTITPTTLTHTPTNRYGVYIQDLISLTSKIKLLAGIRYSLQESNGAYIDSVTSHSRTSIDNISNNAFSPRIGIVYQPTKTVSLFTSYSNSFDLNSGTDIYLNPLAPSFINQYEAGIKTELFSKVLAANVTVYKILNSNLAQTALLDANGDANNNNKIKELAGEVESKGLEIDVTTKPIYGVQIIAGYSYNQTKYVKSNTYIKGSKLRYNPEHTANLSLYYTFSNRTVLKGFNMGITSYYVGKRVAGRSTRINVVNDTYKLFSIPDYVQVDASAGYSFEKISLRLKLSNLFNQLSYYIHDDNSVNPIAPRQASATLSFRL
ncbi:TonB-dependent siderophore receptor [soil metagenome]